MLIAIYKFAAKVLHFFDICKYFCTFSVIWRKIARSFVSNRLQRYCFFLIYAQKKRPTEVDRLWLLAVSYWLLFDFYAEGVEGFAVAEDEDLTIADDLG